MEQYLGENLNRARVGDLLILDGREFANPSASRSVPAGVYRITRREGRAPSDVHYYGLLLTEEEVNEHGH